MSETALPICFKASETGKTKTTLNHVPHTEDIHNKKQDNDEDCMYTG